MSVVKITPCRPYHSRTVYRHVLRLAGGKSAFKLYYLSLIGRDEPQRFEWGYEPHSFKEFEQRFVRLGMEGVGFVTIFPHITKVFRWAPSMETVLHVRAFQTPTLQPMDLGREDGFVEFACYAEAAIGADEYHAWARARSVEEYLDTFSDFTDGPVAARAK